MEKSDFLTRSFLKTGCRFTEVHRGKDFGLLEVKYNPEGEKKEEEEEEEDSDNAKRKVGEAAMQRGDADKVEAMDTDEAAAAGARDDRL